MFRGVGILIAYTRMDPNNVDMRRISRKDAWK